MMRHRFLTSTLALAAAALLSASSAYAEIVVGVVQSQTGPISAIGIPYVKGVAAAQGYLGEIAGEKIRVIVLDDASDPSTASKNARKLIEEDKVDVLMGSSGTPATAALVAVASELKTPVISPTPLPSVPMVDNKPWAIATPQNPRDMFGIVVDEMKAQGIKTVGFIGFSDGWGDLVYGMAKRAADPYGIEIVTNERYARSDTSVRAQVLKFMSAKPDAFLNGGSGTGGALPLQGLAERGYKGKLYGGPPLINPDFVRLAGAAAEGLVVSAGPVAVLDQLPDNHPSKPIGLKYREAYVKVHGEPPSDTFAAYLFDCWLIMAEAATRALPKAKPGTPEFRSALRDEIYATKEVVGTHGVYNYTPASHWGTDRRALVLVTFSNGQWKFYKQ